MTKLTTEEDVLEIIRQDEWRMEVLRTVRPLQLPDWWLGAGFVRNAVWDALHGFERTPLNDIDLIYFDPAAEPVEDEKRIWQQLKDARPDIIWSATNVAHRHLKLNRPPFTSATDGLAHWVETATCVGVRLNDDDTLELTAPHGIDDLVQGIIRHNPLHPEDVEVYHQRVRKKNWEQQWPRLQIIW